MARLSQLDIDTLSLKAGFIKVTVRDGYDERFVSVNDVIKELMELREEKENECGKVSKKAEALKGAHTRQACGESGTDV